MKSRRNLPGHESGQVVAIDKPVPNPAEEADATVRGSMEKALNYIGLTPGTLMTDVAINKVFIGSCTNSRIEDLRSAAAQIRGRRVADGVTAIVVPGSGQVKAQAEAEGWTNCLSRPGLSGACRAAPCAWR